MGCGCSGSGKKVAPKQQPTKKASTSTPTKRVAETRRIIRRPSR